MCALLIFVVAGELIPERLIREYMFREHLGLRRLDAALE
jgi:hypothetical protein